MTARAWIATALFTLVALVRPVPSGAAGEAKKPPTPPPASSAEPLKMPGAEAQSRMFGTWAIRVTYEPGPGMPRGGVALGREVWRAGPGGRSVIEEYEEKGDTGEFHGLGVSWWDDKEQRLRTLWCGSSDPKGCQVVSRTASWEGNTLIFTEETEENGRRLLNQEIFTDITASSFTQLLKSGPSASEMKTTMTIRATRLPDVSHGKVP